VSDDEKKEGLLAVKKNNVCVRVWTANLFFYCGRANDYTKERTYYISIQTGTSMHAYVIANLIRSTHPC
jgi:hypothetical protein